jgi:hypothetical protein
MTPDEAALMQAHATYWHEGIVSGAVVAFGFVADPAGAFGAGIVEVDDAQGAQAFTDADPVIRANRGFGYRIALMPLGVASRR